jgi:hypothetical protein
MEKRYVYARLYDYCVNDDYKNPGRGVIRRKQRIPAGIFSYVILVASCLFLIHNVSYQKLVGVFGMLAAMVFLYEARMGVISLINYYRVEQIRKKGSQNILEKFCVYHNKDGNYIKLQDRHFIRVLHHPFDWCIVSLLFRDEMKNKYIFRVSLKEISFKIKLSKSFKKSQSSSFLSELPLLYKYNLKVLEKIDSVKELTEFIRDEYRSVSSKFSEVSKNNLG